MKKFFVLARYTPDFFEALIKDPSSDRREHTRRLVEIAGSKMLDYSLTRGEFDFVVVQEAPDFETLAAIKNCCGVNRYGNRFYNFGGH